MFLILFLVFITTSAIDFDDSSCDSSSEEHGGGRPARPGTCGQHWHTFKRPQGTWCVRVVTGDVDYYRGLAECAKYGAVLSGIQNNQEREWIANKAVSLNVAAGKTHSGVWLGAQRTSATAFRWTDGHTTGTEAMVFGPGQPDNDHGAGRGPQRCLQLMALTPSYWNIPGHLINLKSGQLDDIWCNVTLSPRVRMYLCGKKA
ncbi:C-type lectin domain-containing protein [Caenorhabditis elegans]|uniref:C-type lectin domain-containing protein n=1 Tax=Caenorhabditis elegans TaxID=6239 RepID=Q9NA92_CAEEL|nr:C-type lectin domain-containing protein [Caenorhabditis elegans]CAB60592.1 C-type lectin domain-containing protein [Caenorhabditis elegans]|eukprot:NP_492880.1 C-type LECtin [Caenorhabditis elegans]